MVMTRQTGWEMAFSDYLAAARGAPFAWGTNDCMLFAAKAVEVITGLNFYKQYLPYNTESEANLILQANGGLQAMVSKVMGNGYTNYRQARRGDLALIKMPDFSLGIIDDSGQGIASVAPGGAVRLPIRMAARVWSY